MSGNYPTILWEFPDSVHLKKDTTRNLILLTGEQRGDGECMIKIDWPINTWPRISSSAPQ